MSDRVCYDNVAFVLGGCVTGVAACCDYRWRDVSTVSFIRHNYTAFFGSGAIPFSFFFSPTPLFFSPLFLFKPCML